MRREATLDYRSGAVFSDDGLYRTMLWRTFNPDLPHLAFCMLNPSMATGTHDDPTTRRCVEFAAREQHGGIFVVNLCAYRTAHPEKLFLTSRNGVDVIFHKENQRAINDVCDQVGKVVVAWGSMAARPEWIRELAGKTVARLRKNADLFCLGRTRQGDPRHPLMLRADVPLSPFY